MAHGRVSEGDRHFLILLWLVWRVGGAENSTNIPSTSKNEKLWENLLEYFSNKWIIPRVFLSISVYHTGWYESALWDVFHHRMDRCLSSLLFYVLEPSAKHRASSWRLVKTRQFETVTKSRASQINNDAFVVHRKTDTARRFQKPFLWQYRKTCLQNWRNFTNPCVSD